MTLDARVIVRLGTLSMDAHLRAQPGELVAIVGPNGAGKTTLLRALAGLQPLDDGHVRLDDRDLSSVPPHRRGIAMVAQRDYLLGHLTALENAAFAAPRTAAAALLDRVGVPGEMPARSLSGGQAKRVALARALAVRPEMLLLDEPLASLDPASHRSIRRELRTWLSDFGGVQIMVTHHPVDALALADRIVVLEQGRIAQDVTPAELRVRPRSAYVAEFVGLNLLHGVGRGSSVMIASGAEIVTAEATPEGTVLAVIHPRAVSLHLSPPGGSPRNTWLGTVADIDDEGTRARVGIEGAVPLVAEVTSASVERLEIAIGAQVYATVKATEIEVFPA